MTSSVGTILREARNRRKVDLSSVEEATRIRVRFLRAIENEEWDVLPGGVYTRSFIRTYAAYLGLDGERLADDFRREVEGGGRGPGAELTPVPASAPARAPGGRRATPNAGWIAAVAAVAVAVLAIALLPGGGGGGDAGKGSAHGSAPRGAGGNQGRAGGASGAAQPRGVSVRLSATAEVWVCLLDARGTHLVDGQILEAGAEEGPFRSGSFTVSFGNGEVAMKIDGKQAEIPATSSPVGYSIDGSGTLTELSESERPSCT